MISRRDFPAYRKLRAKKQSATDPVSRRTSGHYGSAAYFRAQTRLLLDVKLLEPSIHESQYINRYLLAQIPAGPDTSWLRAKRGKPILPIPYLPILPAFPQCPLCGLWLRSLRPKQRKQNDVPNGVRIRQKHAQPIHAYADSPRGRHPVGKRANVVLIHLVRLLVPALALP